MLLKSKIIFICWGREAILSLNYAKMLDAKFKQVYFKKIGQFTIPVIFRYIVQFFYTFFILMVSRPKMVIVQNPPVFAPLTVWFYCLLFRAKFVIDTHTAAFWDKKWMFFYPFFRFVAKRAKLNTYHNFKNADILNSWGLKNILPTHFGNPDFTEILKVSTMKNKFFEQKLRNSPKSVLMVNRFASDDDFETVIETAELMPETTFFITGNIPNKLSTRFANLNQKNIIFTAYIIHDEFIRLMNRVDLVLAFTLRRDTKLWSIQEILALNKPLITTDSEVLKHYFSDFAFFNNSDAKKLKEQIKYVFEHEAEIKNKVKDFLIKDKIICKKQTSDIRNFINKELK